MYYKVVYVHRGETAERSLFLPGDSSYTITDGVLSLSVGASGSLKLSIPESNPAKAEIKPLTDEIVCYRNGAELFRGRAVSDAEDFYLTGTLLVEGMLSYLCDTQMPPFEHQGSPSEFIQLVLDNHNEHVTEDRKLYLGEVTVLDKNDYIARSATGWQTSLAALTSRLTGSTLSGYLRVRYSGGKRYLDYLASYGTQAAQEVRLDRNILDIAKNIEYSEVYTAFLPLGKADDETGKRLTIESVNGGSPYLEDDTAVAQYGWIVGTKTWDDVTEAANLKTKGEAAFAQVKSPVAKFTVSAIDMAMASEDEVAICLGDMVQVRSDPHDLNQLFELTGMELNLLNPAADALKFGAETASITSGTRDSLQNLSEGLNSVAVRLNSIVATTITVEYLSAHYAKVEDLEATNANIKNLVAENAEIKNLVAENADLTNADIENLNADVANIKTLLAGSAGVGELQAVHLTADNTVIADALITDAMIANLSAGKLTAGQIVTDLIQIMSENGRLLLDGETLQIKDANRVRVQIGRDAAGDYNLALWDAAGNLLWDASGVYAAGLHDGIIRDIAVADDANISGGKLDISSVAQKLTEDGTLEVTGSQVTIDNTRLDVAYKTITTKTETAQSTAEAAQSTANTAKTNAAAAQSAADQAQEDAAAAVEQVGAVTERTTALETNLSVVQGQIQSKVWQSDITEAVDPVKGEVDTLKDQYTQVTQDVDSIGLSVKELTTTMAATGGRNLIIESTATEGRIGASGDTITDAGHWITDWIQVEPESAYTLTAYADYQETEDGTAAFLALSLYRADQAHISRVINSSKATAWTSGQPETITTPADAAFVRVSYPSYLSGAIKLEKGSVGTNYTPAPEDTNAELQAEMREIQASLEMQADEIEMRVAAMQVGGRNLIRNSSGNLGETIWSNLTYITCYDSGGVQDRPYFNYTRNLTSSSSRGFLDNHTFPQGISAGEAYTVSGYIRINNSVATEIQLGIRCNSGGTIWVAETNQIFGPDSGWTYFSAAGTVDADYSGTTYPCFQIAISAGVSADVDFCSIKVERGTMPTDWTPAPEDIDSSVEAKLELKVDRDKMISEINASADVINLQSDRLVVNSTNFKLAQDGTVTATNGNFSGEVTANSGYIGDWSITSGHLSAERTISNQTYQYVVQAPSDAVTYNHIIYSRHRASSSSDWTFDLYLTYDGTIACRKLEIVSGGSMSVDGNASVTGSLSTYGYTVPRIQHGSVSVSITANTAVDFSVTFPKSFPGVPTVILTPRHNSASTSINYKVRTATTTGFTGYIYTSGAGTWVMNWMAMYG